MGQMVGNPKVTVIPARPRMGIGRKNDERQKIRVAAYCRVSTDSDEQATSYEAQIEHYTAFIKKNPDWEFAGIFADDGISGTDTRKREPIHRFIANAGAIIMKEIVSVKRANGKTIEYRAIVVNGKIVCFDYDSSSGLPSPESLPCAWQFEDCINTASKNGLHGAYFVDFGVDENENIFVVECKNIINGTVKNINAFAEGLAKIAMD